MRKEVGLASCREGLPFLVMVSLIKQAVTVSGRVGKAQDGEEAQHADE